VDANAQIAEAVIDEAGDGEVSLELGRVFQAGETDWPVSWYSFSILIEGAPVGGIRLRVGDIELLRLWAGHIGCNVDRWFRGRRVAERATRLLLPLAAVHQINPVWLTCAPENIASRLTLDRLGAVLVETVPVPAEYALFEPLATLKQRYRLDLAASASGEKRPVA
jgi:tagatose 1,6-diphosphate aldolase